MIPGNQREASAGLFPALLDEAPLVSIIMPAYDAAQTISASIESVYRQSWSRWELVIVVDAATDRTLQIAQAWAARDTRIRVLPSSVNKGVAESRNVGVRAARGAYIAFLDSDDLWLEDKLAAQVEFMTSSGVQVCYTNYQRFNSSGMLAQVISPIAITYQQLLKGNAIGNLTGMVDRDLAARVPFRAVGHEDYLFWLSVLAIAGVARRLPQNEPMALYRVQAQSLSGSKWRSLRWQWRIYREHLKLSVPYSLWLMLHYAIQAVRKRQGGAGDTMEARERS